MWVLVQALIRLMARRRLLVYFLCHPRLILFKMQLSIFPRTQLQAQPLLLALPLVLPNVDTQYEQLREGGRHRVLQMVLLCN